jgi:hypothetical protein
MPMYQQPADKYRRTHKYVIALNDYEAEAFEHYCKKYKVHNRAKIIREALFTKVLTTFDKDYPTLFDKEELARLERRAV